MSDLISRQDAIEAVATVTMSIHLSNVLCDKLLALPSAETPTVSEKHQLSEETPTNAPTDLISRQDAIEAIASRDETNGTVEVFTGRQVNEILSALPSADRPTGEWISEELENMICNEICYYKEVTADAESLNDLCEGCLIKKRNMADRQEVESATINNEGITFSYRKTGEWIMSENQREEDVANGNYLYYCSNCEHADLHAETQEVPYCWYCGADMRGEEA